MDDLNIYETVKTKVVENATFTKVDIDEIDPINIANMFEMAKLFYGNSGISDDMIDLCVSLFKKLKTDTCVIPRAKDPSNEANKMSMKTIMDHINDLEFLRSHWNDITFDLSEEDFVELMKAILKNYSSSVEKIEKAEKYVYLWCNGYNKAHVDTSGNMG